MTEDEVSNLSAVQVAEMVALAVFYALDEAYSGLTPDDEGLDTGPAAPVLDATLKLPPVLAQSIQKLPELRRGRYLSAFWRVEFRDQTSR